MTTCESKSLLRLKPREPDAKQRPTRSVMVACELPADGHPEHQGTLPDWSEHGPKPVRWR